MIEFLKQIPAALRVGFLLLLLTLLSVLYAWYTPVTPEPLPVFTKPAPIPSVKDLNKEDVALAQAIVKALPKAKVVKKIKLPPEVVNNPAIQITDTAELPPSTHGTEVVSTIDTTTGETTILSKPKPVPLFEFENQKRIGVGYAVLDSKGTSAKVYGEYTALRVGNFHVGVQADLTIRSYDLPEAKVLGVIDYRW